MPSNISSAPRACNVNTYRLSRDEVGGLLEHCKPIGKGWEEAMRMCKEPIDIYPNYEEPVTLDARRRFTRYGRCADRAVREP